MEAEPWEALDLDDSDLPSLLRPCKRHLSNPKSPSRHQSPSHPPTADNLNPLRLISGPAGAIQAAMHRMVRRNEGSKISTQDYVMRAEEEAAEDFASDRWVSAMDFVRREGGMRFTSLSEIKKCVDAEKIDTVVAMIQGCTPNGLGDLMVVLKDPTDTMQASIHRKVLSEGDYGRHIAVGSVLILQKVSVFSPLDKTFYLNISLNNVVKVFPKDAGREILSTYIAKGATPEGHESLKIPEAVSLGYGRAANTRTDVELNFNTNSTPSVEKLVGAENSGLGSQFMVDRNSSQYASLQQRFKRDRAGSNTMKEPVDLVSVSQVAVMDKMTSTSSCIQPVIDLRDDHIAENLTDENHFPTNATQKKTQVEEQAELNGQDFGLGDGINSQYPTAKGLSGENLGLDKHSSLPLSKPVFQEWTDEQLDILDMDVDI